MGFKKDKLIVYYSDKRDTHRLSRWFFSCGPKGLACQLRLPALVRFTLANYFPLPVNGSSKFSVSCSLISSSSSWFCIYFRIFPSFFPTVLTLIPTTPELPIPIFKLHIPPFFIYHQAAFPFQKSHKTGYTDFWWYF